jgi:hypothetical protein
MLAVLVVAELAGALDPLEAHPDTVTNASPVASNSALALADTRLRPVDMFTSDPLCEIPGAGTVSPCLPLAPG